MFTLVCYLTEKKKKVAGLWKQENEVVKWGGGGDGGEAGGRVEWHR